MQKTLLTSLCVTLLVIAIACFVTRKSPAPKQQGASQRTLGQPATSQTDARIQSIKVVIEEALSKSSTPGYSPIPRGTRLLSVNVTSKVEKEIITLNFSKELISNGVGVGLEDAVHQILVRIGNSTSEDIKETEYTIYVEGLPLDRYKRQ